VSGAANESIPAARGLSSTNVGSELSGLSNLRFNPPTTPAESSSASAPPRRMLIDLMHEERPTAFTAHYSNLLQPDTAQARPSVVTEWQQGQSFGQEASSQTAATQHSSSSVSHGVRPSESYPSRIPEIEIVEVSEVSACDSTPRPLPSAVGTSSSRTTKVRFRDSVDVEGPKSFLGRRKSKAILKDVNPNAYKKAYSNAMVEKSSSQRCLNYERDGRIELAAARLEQLVLNSHPGVYDGLIAQGRVPPQVLMGMEGLGVRDYLDIITKFNELPIKRREDALLDDAARKFMEMVDKAPEGTYNWHITKGLLPEEFHAEFDDELLSRDREILAICNRMHAEARRLAAEATLLADD